MAVTTCFLKKIHYLTNEEKEIAPKIMDLVLSNDYESKQLGIALFLEVFGKYYVNRAIDSQSFNEEICKCESHKYKLLYIEWVLKRIISKIFVYEQNYGE